MKHLTPKTAVKIFALTVSLFLVISAKQTYAAGLPDILTLLPTSSNMFNWSENFIIGLLNNAVARPLIGCTFDQLTGTTDEATQRQKVEACVGKSVLTTSGTTSYVPNSLLGGVVTLAVDAPRRSDLYPVNLAVYLDDLKKDSPIIPTSAYAAPIQAEFMNTIMLPLWKSLRNLSYVLFVLILVAFGFMVMFRYKINPQTVITVQASLPKVVISLLLITFSWPIGAMAIELVGVLITFVSTLAPFPNDPGSIVTTIIMMVLGPVIAGVGAATTGIGIPAALLLVALPLVLIVIILFALLAIFISSITRMIRIVVMTAFAPLQFTIGALPGHEDAVSNWFKGLLANMLAVPAMWLMMDIGFNIFLNGAGASFTQATSPGGALIGAFIGGFLSYILGLWFIWNARSVPKIVEGALGVGGGWVPGQAPKTAGRK